MEVSYHPKEKEVFEYKIKVSRDCYKGYEEYVTGALSLELKIIIQRTIELQKKFNAYVEGEVFLHRTDKRKTSVNGNALWNGLGYKTKEEWEKIIFSYQTIGQIQRDFLL